MFLKVSRSLHWVLEKLSTRIAEDVGLQQHCESRYVNGTEEFQDSVCSEYSSSETLLIFDKAHPYNGFISNSKVKFNIWHIRSSDFCTIK
ncbi:hypothetical protein C0J52_08492 [Blattella germanica]|nr:hypothetical protein C0J52_08492 [Blattella germanica]